MKRLQNVLHRRELRLALLVELYEHYFASGGQAKQETLTPASERELACRFLEEKGYIRRHAEGGDSAPEGLQITAAGMEYVEQHILRQSMTY